MVMKVTAISETGHLPRAEQGRIRASDQDRFHSVNWVLDIIIFFQATKSQPICEEYAPFKHIQWNNKGPSTSEQIPEMNKSNCLI